MADNEKLIEDAAKAIAAFTDPAAWTQFRGEAEAALSVFEKAHTPSDDEVNDVALHYWGASVVYDREKLREALAPFRRDEVRSLMSAIEAAYNALHLETRSAAVKILGDAIEGETSRELNSPAEPLKGPMPQIWASPTDDEREAMRRIIAEGSYARSNDDLPYQDVADRLVAAGFGFRRTEVPEPSTEPTLNERIVRAIANQRPWFIEKADDVLDRIKTDTTADVMLYHDAVSVLVAAKTMYELVATAEAPEPQGEPSDALATIDEALRLWNDGHGLYDGAWVTRQAENMAQTLQQARAALRAAGGVR